MALPYIRRGNTRLAIIGNGGGSGNNGGGGGGYRGTPTNGGNHSTATAAVVDGSPTTMTATGDSFELLKQNEEFLVEHIQWSEQLETRLVEYGLLEGNSRVVRNSVQKVRDVVENTVRSGRQSALQSLVEALEESDDNTDVSVKLRQELALDDVSYDSDVDTTELSFDPQDKVTLERKLLETRRRMKQWQLRARTLESEKMTLEEDRRTMQQMFEHTLKAGDEASVTIGKLQSKQELLQHELLKKERGLGLWKKKEQEYQAHISQLRGRIDEMSGMRWQREATKEKVHLKQQTDVAAVTTGGGGGHQQPKQAEGFATTIASLAKVKRNHDRSNTDPTTVQLPVIRPQGGIKTLPHNAKLPSLVGAPRPPPEGASGEDNLPKKLPISRPKTLIDASAMPANSKLPPLIQSKKLPSPRGGGGKSLLPDISPTSPERPPVEKGERPPAVRSECSTLKAVMGEKWIDRQGGEIDIGNIALHIPPNSVSAPVLITITETDHKEARMQQIREAGLAPYMKPGLQVRLQPHGQRFLRPIYMQMKGAKVNSPGKLLIFHKEVDVHEDFDWTDVTEDVKPTVRKDDVIISIDRFSIIETMRLLVPVVSLAAGMAIGYNMSLLRTHALALLNDKRGPCEFHVFHRERDPCLQVLCLSQDRQSTNNNNLNEKFAGNPGGLKYLGYQSSRFELCDGERLFFFFDKNPEIAASFIFNHQESRSKGQRFQIPLPKGSRSRGVGYPELLLVKRRVAEQLDDVTLCEAYLHSKTPGGGTGLDEPDGAPAATETTETPWEEAIRSNRVAIVKNVDVRDILSYLIQGNVISIDEQEEIKSYRTRRERVEALVDKLSVKGQKGFRVFVQALSEDYEDLSLSLQKAHTILAT